MKAMRLKAYNQLEIVDVAVPEPREDELLIRVEAVGICGSDVHGLDGSTGRRIPPVIMGHEASGVVESVGAGCRHFQEGDSVTFDSTLFCGDCWYCNRGETNFCENRRVLGVSCDEYRQDGAFAEYVVVPERVAELVPDGIPFEHAAMIEPVAIAVHAVNITPRAVGETAVVVGSGIIGLLTMQVAKSAGFSTVIVSDPAQEKLEVARELGADVVVNPTTQDLNEVVLSKTAGRGAAVAFDAVGTAAALQGAIRTVRRGGTVTLIGNVQPTIELPNQYLVSRQIRLQGSNATVGEIPFCLELVDSGQVRLEPLISAVAPLSQGPDWFHRLYTGEPGLLKVILKPQEG